jgi:PBSX family phage terminase large subunit
VALALEHRYTPRGSAKDIFNARDPEVLLVGAAGTGKSRACLEKVHLMCLLNPNMRALIVRKTQVSLASTALDTYRKFVATEALAVGQVHFHGGGPQDPPQYRYSNGATITIGGMDRSTRIMSSEYDMVYVQEATELFEEDWEALTTRLRNWKVSFQQILADCNPDRPTHWLKVRADVGKVKMFTSLHEDNPILFDENGKITERGASYMAKLDALSGVRKLRLRDGKWAAAEGLIYGTWTDKAHLLDRFPIPKDWPRYWSVDFGFTNPFVCQMWAMDPDGRLYLYREVYHTQRTVDVHAKNILALVQDEDGAWTEPKPSAIICDHDAESRAVFAREVKMSTIPANKKVTEGIQAVQMRMNPRQPGGPRLFILRDSVVGRDQELLDAKKPTCTAEEVVGYVWEKQDGETKKETPLKVNDHGMDAKRYMVTFVDLGSKPRLRMM